jgi:methyl-accepting chemotaxis protein
VIGFAVGGILLGLGLAWAIGARIAKPVSQMRDAMRRLASGDRSVAIPAVGRKDEIGQMAEAVDVFKANLIETERLRVEQEALKARSETDRRAEMIQLANQFELAVGGIIQTVSSSSSQLQSTASALSSSAQQLTGRAQTVSGASEEAAANVGTVATAAEELASSVEEIGRQVTESARVAGEAARGAESTVAKVRDLSTAAQKIGDVVDLINNIAAQTNLLALNATIEAARAGEAGKGFAVVAAEVKQLADQTARATSDIAGQIQGIQVSTADSVDAITSIADVIARINGIASTIASAVEEQGAATREIARNVQLAAEGTSMVTENIGEVSIASSDVSAASGQVLGAAGDLNKQSQSLRQEVTRFLETVRSA